jgi:uncharacterized protein YjbJ (UPF0337 family)
MTARSLAEQIRSVGAESTAKAAAFGAQVADLAGRTRETDQIVAEAAQRLAERLASIESASAAAAGRVNEAEASFSGALDALLERAATSLEEIRSGIDAQAAAVAALVEQASAGIGRAGVEAAESLGTNIERANSALAALSGQVAEQDRASQLMIAEIDRGLALIDQRFAELAANGDQRANHFLESLTRARGELESLSAQAGSQDQALGAIAERTAALRETVDRLAGDIREQVGTAIGEAQGGADRLVQTASAVRPEIGWIRDTATEASERLAASGAAIGEQQQGLAALLASVDDGVGIAQSKLSELASLLAQVEREAANLSGETGPA